jgi:hypothetical protein
MRIVVATLIIALLAGSASAQNTSGGGFGGKGAGKGRNSSQNTENQKAEQEKKKAAENAYKAGLQRIPVSKEQYDPWRNAR